MSLQYVRDYYGVPAKRGGRVTYDGEGGRILSADHHLIIKLDSGRRVRVHPRDTGLTCLKDRAALQEGEV
jgi:hypothetical protein